MKSNRDKNICFAINSDLKNRAVKLCEKNSLSLSELARRGLVEQIQELEGDNANGD